jgi:hypothetical protein
MPSVQGLETGRATALVELTELSPESIQVACHRRIYDHGDCRPCSAVVVVGRRPEPCPPLDPRSHCPRTNLGAVLIPLSASGDGRCPMFAMDRIGGSVLRRRLIHLAQIYWIPRWRHFWLGHLRLTQSCCFDASPSPLAPARGQCH